MTYRRFRAIAERVRYKPGWRVTVTRHLDEAVVWVDGKVQDAYPPHQRTEVQTVSYFRVGKIRTERAVLKAVHSAICNAEDHEVGEWFRYKGRRPFDPHEAPTV